MNLKSIKNKISTWFRSPGLFQRKKLLFEAKRNGVIIDNGDIDELFKGIDSGSNYVQLIIKAKKAGFDNAESIVSDFFKIRRSNETSLESLINPLIEAKKKGLEIKSDEIKALYDKNKPISKIIKALVTASKKDTDLKIEDVKTLFYNDKKVGKQFIKQFAKTKKHFPTLTSAQFNSIYFKNISVNEFYNISKLLNQENLQIPFFKLTELIETKSNIIKTILILSDAKKASEQELQKYNYFSTAQISELANTYVIEGKNKFKTELSKSLLNELVLVDPVSLYFKLTRSAGKGFKITLETIKDYLSFDYKADIGKVTDSYLNARQNNLTIKYDQLAQLAQQEVDVEEFIEAQIKSGADE
ncbi:MAG: hypothetical protein U9N85_00475 [Bacteroidota bacterium]|nr:hypothetical protein [Bacteroidota bacterium]